MPKSAETVARFVELRVENFQRLKAIEIRPEGTLTTIAGRNDQGKSSILKAMSTLIIGQAGAPIRAIRDGEEEALLHGDLGTLKITRTIKKREDGTEAWGLRVVMADGSRPDKPQTSVLNALRSDHAIDPLAFSRMAAKDQFTVMTRLVPSFDFDKHDRAHKVDFDKRTDANRTAKEQTAAADAIVLPPGPEPVVPTADEIIAEMDAASKHNADIRERHTRRNAAAAQVETDLDTAERKRAEAQALILEAEQLEAEATEKQARLDAAATLPAPIDEAAIRQKLTEIEKLRAAAALHVQRRDYQAKAAIAVKESEALTAAMKARDAAKHDAISKAQMPVQGLDLVDGVVHYRGLPLEQSGTAERLRVGMAIAMSLQPRLRCIWVDEIGSLDSEHLRIIEDMANEAEPPFQIWATKMSETGDVGIVIEAGEIVSTPQTRAKQ